MEFDLSLPGESADVVIAPGTMMRVTRLSLDVAEVYFVDDDGTRIPTPWRARNEISSADLEGSFYLARGQRYTICDGDRTAAFFDATARGWTIFL